jgi:uncharacterized surface protein with fasciclin (FAS1) repeats
VINVLIFILMLLIVLVGKPFLPGANSFRMEEPELGAGLWAQVDQKRFPRMNLDQLFFKNAEEKSPADESFTTIGVAKRLPLLDEHGSIALMTSVMFCCVADVFAVGFRIPYEQWESIEDGQLIMVSGKLDQPGPVLEIPNFRFGMAMMSTIHSEIIIQPDAVMTYDSVAQLPLLTEKLKSDNLKLFCRALEQTGLWQTLQEEGPYTVFAPVDQAMELLDEELFADTQLESLKQLLSYHIVPGRYYSRELAELKSIKSLNGYKITIEMEYGKLKTDQVRLLFKGKLKTDQVRLLFKDVEAKNGVIHFIYPVIVPAEFEF